MNGDFEEGFVGSAAQLAAWADEYGALPEYLIAALLFPEDRPAFLQTYVRRVVAAVCLWFLWCVVGSLV